MKCLVVSDSHGLTEELSAVVKRHQADVDICIHCGDSELAADSVTMIPFLGVQGNCDTHDVGFPNERIYESDGLTVFITHGHLYQVKMSMMNLWYKAREAGAKVVFFGHTHVAGTGLKDGILFLNPGSLRMPRLRKEKTYAICEWKQSTGQFTVDYFTANGDPVKDLSSTFNLSSIPSE
ncbi:metallophosphoesterase family protein [Camelliibacillus cellulosilyticus]|uniref:Phosphoesterase n=1 Tax=Camelliibacillus cellulosilyticus TaxID=2174486 RepID=A0ABV9GND4_9BACL